MSTSRRAGFTLIELLTVIAIIAILAAMVFTVGPGMIRRAKITRMENALKQLNVALVAYSTDNKRGSYPPAYGFVGVDQGNNQPPPDTALDGSFYHLRPYLALTKQHGEQGLYDEFSESYDTNRDGVLSLLEFSPVGRKTPQQTWVFDSGLPRYMEGAVPAVEIGRQLGPKQKRPFIYVPVNRAQWQRASKFWIRTGDFLATRWDATAPELQTITFPPTKYDAYVLIGVGPDGRTFGLVDDPPFLAQVPARDAYHLAALRTYFLATRDLNANSKLDFDWTARTKEGEAAVPEYQVAPSNKSCNNDLPCADAPRGAGPWIYVSQ